ncbi:BZ3500_MvSof-1268-A1-R1_C078g00415 [Microbotryum saponariae]|uniref:BZ3500_MvSof-1268-A1-R1_C078g00415 protein n=1 Tax=Microbotryum saponariae TaxID=289078 RepID=A0A2X0KM98_9BASI|nr:BZ3500_MvSof-1268-A1-R1_C078g00415 [Microbotryum saponariae]
MPSASPFGAVASQPAPPQPPHPGRHRLPGNAATASKVVFPKHARLDGPKSFTNWLRQLRLALPNQLAARDDAAREIIVGSIDSADVSATLDAIPSDDLSAPRILPLSRLVLHRTTLHALSSCYDTWLREYMSIAQEIRDAKTSLNDVLATHVLAMVPSCLDSFRLTTLDLAFAMLATSSPCPACRAPGHRLRDCTSRAKHPPTGPCRRCHKKGHWALDCKNRGEQARSSDDTQDDTSSSAASQPNVGYLPPASSLVANSQLTPL